MYSVLKNSWDSFSFVVTLKRSYITFFCFSKFREGKFNYYNYMQAYH